MIDVDSPVGEYTALTIAIRRTDGFDRWLSNLNDDRAIARIETRLFRLSQGGDMDRLLDRRLGEVGLRINADTGVGIPVS